MRRSTRFTPSVMTLSILAMTSAGASDLSIEERVNAQEAIERVYYSHQIGTTLPFAQAVPRRVLEQKVSKYLRQSAALDSLWSTPITAEMLQREMERISRDTRLPQRLREIERALGNDAFVIQECLVRPVLADHLSRSFFATDARIHAASRVRADELRERLLRGESIEPLRAVERRRVLEFTVSEASSRKERKIGGEATLDRADVKGANQVSLSFEDSAALFSRRIGRGEETVSVREEPGAFVVETVLERSAAFARASALVVPKRTWDNWWCEVESSLDPRAVRATAHPDAATGTNLPSNTDAPSDDTWDNGLLDDVPDARGYHTAVWTGSVMVIWGGFIGGSSYYNLVSSGGRYDPLTDRWSPMSVVNAPEGRDRHSAVWTGTEMIVWGG